jgi:hypothetical protein
MKLFNREAAIEQKEEGHLKAARRSVTKALKGLGR